ncbi:P-loop containing nucleoside triphosphate hydrolase protein [Xylaria flabelliformis]|nr:P-loop containing nucleoside triphosphate hydrolase protein [Xylaria flabelliformis]
MRFLLNSSRLAKTSCLRRPPAVSHHVFFSTVTSHARKAQGSKKKSKRAIVAAATKLENISQHQPELTKRQERETQRTYAVFRRLSLACLDDFVRTNDWTNQRDLYAAFGITSTLDFDREVKLFRTSVAKACDFAAEEGAVSRKENPLFWSLRNAFVTDDTKGLTAELKSAFYSFLMRSRFPESILATHQKIADMRFPYEWFPATRALQRTVHLHVGPTNSGKTYNALKALENAKTGIYAGPLRLLAHEVYSRFTAKGLSCALITGEEQRIPKDANTYFKSCTVEMAPLNHQVDVAVIDEIQMIGDIERGWAWTQAFLGVQAKEVHLCGEERTVELIQSLCANLGDECVVHRYKRLSGLETMHESLGGRLENLQKGDAVVSFTRIGIHALKRQIESATGRRCAVVYGSLPPETRAQQAALFNDPDNDYDYLAASDAIGMGLNLEIRRVVFEATQKRDSHGYRQMSVSELKQIGGRAGRYRTANHAIRAGASDGEEAPKPEASGPGLVTALVDEDLAVVIRAFNSEPEPIKTAGLQPPTSAIERLSTYFPPNTPLSFILIRLREIAKLSSKFHLCHPKEMLAVADLIQPFPMSIYDRCVFLNAPVALRDRNGPHFLQALARCVSRMEGGDLVDIPELPLEILDSKLEDWGERRSEYLQALESLHKSITLYLWVSYRFTGIFRSQNLAFHVKEQVEAKINEYLSGVSLSVDKRRKRIQAMREAAERRRVQEQLLEETSPQRKPNHEGVGDWNEEGHEEPLYDDPSQLEDIKRLEPRSGKRRARR